MKIFLSYASKEAKIAEEIQMALAASGHQVFFDRNSLPPGGDYNARIRKAIKESDGMIFLISSHSIAKGSYALTEMKFARDKWGHPRGHVLPVMVSATNIKNIPVFLRAVTILEPLGNIAAEVAAAVANRPLGNEQVDIIETLSAVEQELHAHEDKFKRGTEKRRRDVSAYFIKISECLHDVYESLKKNEVPHGRCAELEGYAEMLPDTVSDFIGKRKSQELAKYLKTAHRVEGLWDEVNASPEKRKRLPEIDKTSGKFTALANSVSAGLQ